MLATGISITIAITSVNFILFNYIFDYKYFEGRLYAPLLTLSVIMSTLSLFFGGIQISMKQSKSNGISTVIGAIVNIVVHLTLVEFIGLYAACISTLISNIMVVCIRAYMIRDAVKLRIDSVNYVYILICVYITACVYLMNNFAWNIANLVIATVVFLFANRKYVISTAEKIKVIKR